MTDFYNSLRLTEAPANLDKEQWVLGRIYHFDDPSEKEKCESVIRSILWCTYRKNFAALGETGITSDSGWGCMIRCGQMAFAQALVWMQLGKEWQWKEGTKDSVYFDILKLFHDTPEAPFSIHNITKCAEDNDKIPIGNWFGPNNILQVLNRLNNQEPIKSRVNFYIGMNNAVVLEEVRELFKNGPSKPQHQGDNKLSSNETRGVLLSVPLRLGLMDLNPTYIDGIKSFFKMKHCLGMLGGRSKHAVFMIGYSGSHLLYLDPHITQSFEDSPSENDLSYHTGNYGWLDITQLDPSQSLCFFLKDEQDLDAWVQEVPKILDSDGKVLFEVFEESPYKNIAQTLSFSDISLNEDSLSLTDDDEYEILS